MLSLCDFSDLEIKGSEFLECEIRETYFINTNLTNANFSKSDLQASKFQNTNLEKANFVDALNYYIDPITNKIKQARFSYPGVLSLLENFKIKIE